MDGYTHVICCVQQIVKESVTSFSPSVSSICKTEASKLLLAMFEFVFQSSVLNKLHLVSLFRKLLIYVLYTQAVVYPLHHSMLK